jgi:hypothetical protein
VNVLDRASGKWRVLELPTIVASSVEPAVRLFGDWLVTTEMQWESGAHSSMQLTSRSDGERVLAPGSHLPDIPYQYVVSFPDIAIKGDLRLQNLRDNRSLTIHTGMRCPEPDSPRSISRTVSTQQAQRYWRAIAERRPASLL